VTPPLEARTIAGLVAELERHGYTGQFAARPGIQVECLTCRRSCPAAVVELDALRRLEGASDPDEMAAVCALRCPHCGALGTLVLPYGPEASAVDAEVLAALDDRRPASPPPWAA
jgi:ferredoxin